MTIEDFATSLDAITKLLGAIIWPALLLFVLVRFGPSLREFFLDLGEFTFKGAGFEASAKRKQAEAAQALVTAAITRPEPGTTPEAAAQQAGAAAAIVAESVTPRTIRRASRSTVLWVDDRPENNAYERQALEALGVTFVLSPSTEDALAKLKQRSFNAIISDMSRPPDQQAGYTLLDTVRKSGDRTPFIIYAGTRARDPEHRAEARRRGALDSTNRAAELFDHVLSAIGR